ncbi:dTDP-4-dehydrorhamnose reductase [Tabrizicola piscis]|uniref:dTDP-4-dehydrorhamnose reductase n=1 Tax=Tabrizicola piscis TaxID=2494374 RepID=A0A3S8U5T2_9RHOB|nr:dTDP-4-dehydrorhamnose reductase [Tabrizicola piscis]AZL59042.1 dTDP-4-dehydrorhamnose reductase [Tabrizicola piscis]
MKVLVFGQTGQVARELVRRAPQGVTVIALGRDRADLADPGACAAVVAEAAVDAVINAAAWTAVDKAETEEPAATIVNGAAAAAMAAAAAARGLPFLHISTDYVFDGTGENPFTPDHPTAPLGAYGRSKLMGEAGVRAAAGRHLILRTSWVFSAHGANFVKTMLRLGRERDVLRVVADQVGGPTPAAAIADALFVAARGLCDGAPGGIHHFAGAPDASWADFAREIMAMAGLGCRVEGIPSSEYPTPAQRPLNSRLDCAGFETAFGMPRPDWRAGLQDVLTELGA